MPHRLSSRTIVALGVAAAVAIGLAATAKGAFSPEVIKAYAQSPDSVDITRWAANAGLADFARWWCGSWIQKTSPYYRPLSSVALYLEYRAFGWDFGGHVKVSWVIHGLICGLLFMLGLQLLPGPLGQRVIFALLAVVLFNVRRGPTGPGWIPAPIAYGVVAWWPGQTDQFCLLFSLPALLLFDRWLTVPSARRTIYGAAGFWAAAMLSKEMAVCLPLLAGVLVLLRRGMAEARPWIATDRGGRPGLAWSVVLGGLALVAGFLLMRSSLVPGAWGPTALTAASLARRIAWFIAYAPAAVIYGRGAWVVADAFWVAATIYAYFRLPRRPSAVWLVLAVVLGAGVLTQVLAGNFATLTIPSELGGVCVVALFLLGIAVLTHVRRGVVWPLLALVLAVHIPIIHVQGPHYMYWPAAFWGLFNASLVQWAWCHVGPAPVRAGPCVLRQSPACVQRLV